MARGRPRKQRDGGGGASVQAATTGYKAELWRMADALPGSMDAAEYRHVVLSLIFLKYISHASEERHAYLADEQDHGADPEDPDDYGAQHIFAVAREARWAKLTDKARQAIIGYLVHHSMAGIARDNPGFRAVLPLKNDGILLRSML